MMINEVLYEINISIAALLLGAVRFNLELLQSGQIKELFFIVLVMGNEELALHKEHLINSHRREVSMRKDQRIYRIPLQIVKINSISLLKS
jgi:hypothetical protein